jgi:hypothetical protein
MMARRRSDDAFAPIAAILASNRRPQGEPTGTQCSNTIANYERPSLNGLRRGCGENPQLRFWNKGRVHAISY